MTDKMDFYDIMGMLIPGFLLVLVLRVGFPSISSLVTPSGVPDAFVVLALTAFAVFLGQTILAISSAVEPLLYWTWGGRPSDRALSTGLGERYLPVDTVTRIKTKLEHAVGQTSGGRSLFLVAMQQAEKAADSRVPQFNALYAYHRSLLALVLVSLVLLALSILWGAASAWSWNEVGSAAGVGLVLMCLLWYRTKQRAYYYVREVLLTSERILTDKVAGSAKATGSKKEG